MAKARDLANLGSDTAALATDAEVSSAVAPKANTTDVNTALAAKADSSAVIANSLVDAKGDLIAGSAADTAARLAVGTNGQVLTADSAEATGLKWATVASGGMTLLATGSLASVSTLTISSISQAYKDLIVDVTYYNPNSNNQGIYLQPNSVTSYRQSDGGFGSSSSSATYINLGQSISNDGGYAPYQTARITFPDYTRSYTQSQLANIYGFFVQGTATIFGGQTVYLAPNMAALTSLKFTCDATYQRGTIKVYGVS